MRRDADRAAWTEFVTGEKTAVNKYGNTREGKYASRREAAHAAQLWTLAKAGHIKELQEQVKITLVPGNGRYKPIVYVADFTYIDLTGTKRVIDVKGARTPVYRLKQKMAALLLGIEIEEV